MKWWSYLLIGLGAYLLILVISLPAEHVLGWTAGNSKNMPFTYGTIKGSLWRGKMEALTVNGVPLDKLKWRFSPSELLFGRLGFDIQLNHAGQELQADVAKGFGKEIQIEDISGVIQAAIIPQLIDMAQIGVDGNVNLNLQQITLSDNQIIYAEGVVQWLSSALKSPFALKVGDLQADLETDDAGAVRAKIKDLGGATAVDGELSLTPDGNFQVNGQIKPGADSDPRLGSALNAISKRKSDGSYQLTYSARL
ncbi:MAG: type II secretion system protein N [Candidatus Thiodiazotropha sp. 'RUGA']|nr:type II secretion system protein N [Candidatus Thiodiazotropha sp. 'RUGA']